MRWVARLHNVGGGGGAKNYVFDTTRYTAPKLAIMAGSRLDCDKGLC